MLNWFTGRANASSKRGQTANGFARVKDGLDLCVLHHEPVDLGAFIVNDDGVPGRLQPSTRDDGLSGDVDRAQRRVGDVAATGRVKAEVGARRLALEEGVQGEGKATGL
jgi:hypothetical protein